MIRYRNIALLVVLLTLPRIVAAQEARPTPSAIDPAKAAVIKDLLRTTGSVNLSKQIMNRMLEAMKPAFPKVGPEIWDRFAAKLNTEEVVDLLIQIYDQHFSREDLEAALAFYKTPAGQRLLKEMPAVMTEAMNVGQEWGQKKTAELVEELKAEEERSAKEIKK